MERLVEQRYNTALNELVGAKTSGSTPRDPQHTLVAVSARVDSLPAGATCSLTGILQWASQCGAVPNNTEPGRYLSDVFYRHAATAEEKPHAPFYQPHSHLASPPYGTIPDPSLPAMAAKTQYKDAESGSMSNSRASHSSNNFLSSRSNQLEVLESVPQHYENADNSESQAIVDHYSRQTSGHGTHYTPPLPEKSGIDFSSNAGYPIKPRLTALPGTPKSREDNGRAYIQVLVHPSLRNVQLPLPVQLEGLRAEWRHCHTSTHVEVKEDNARSTHVIACKAQILRDTEQDDEQVQNLWNKMTAIDRAEEARKKSWWPDQKTAKNNAESRKETLEELRKATIAAEELSEKLRMMEMVEGARTPRTGAVAESELEKRAEGLLDSEDDWVWLEDGSYAMQSSIASVEAK
ncbi:MAG: hypothetical protein Q9191_003059 [Dirinaria sp. TL-2023a]